MQIAQPLGLVNMGQPSLLHGNKSSIITTFLIPLIIMQTSEKNFFVHINEQNSEVLFVSISQKQPRKYITKKASTTLNYNLTLNIAIKSAYFP